MISSAEMGPKDSSPEGSHPESLPQENLVESQLSGEAHEVPNKYAQTAAFFDGFKRDMPKQLDYAQKQGDIESVQYIEEAFARVNSITKSLEVGDTNPAKQKIWEMLEQNEKILQREDLSGVDVVERINTMITLAGYLAELHGVEPKSGKGAEKTEAAELKGEATQELPEWKKEIEKKEGEPVEVVSIRGLLEVIDQGMESGYITSVQNVEYLSQRVEDARARGLDLSSIKKLDEKIEQMRKSAPKAAVEASLRKAEGLKGKDRENALLGWYYFIQETLERDKNSLSDEDVKKFEKRIQKIKEELGLD